MLRPTWAFAPFRLVLDHVARARVTASKKRLRLRRLPQRPPLVGHLRRHLKALRPPRPHHPTATVSGESGVRISFTLSQSGETLSASGAAKDFDTSDHKVRTNRDSYPVATFIHGQHAYAATATPFLHAATQHVPSHSSSSRFLNCSATKHVDIWPDAGNLLNGPATSRPRLA